MAVGHKKKIITKIQICDAHCLENDRKKIIWIYKIYHWAIGQSQENELNQLFTQYFAWLAALADYLYFESTPNS